MIEKRIMFIAILMLTFGANLFSINVVVAQLTAFRFFLLLALILYIYRYRRLKIWGIHNIIFNLVPFICIYSFLTLLWCRNLSDWIHTEFFIIIGTLVYYFFTNTINDNRDIIYYAKAFNISVFVQALIGLYEVVTHSYVYFKEPYSVVSSELSKTINPPYAMIQNTNDFATFMIYGICISYILLCAATKRLKKIFYLGCIIIYSILTVFTESRACIIGLGVLYMSSFVFLEKSNIKKVLYGITICGIMLYFFPMFKKIVVFNFSASSGSDVVRMSLIRSGLLYLKNSLFFGIGPGQENTYVSRYHVGYVGKFTAFHNFWIELLVCFGIITFFFFLFCYIKLFIQMVKLSKSKNKVSRSIASGYVIFLCSFLIVGVSSSSIIKTEAFWTFFALLIAFSNMIYMENYKKWIN